MAAPAHHDPTIDQILEVHDHFDPPGGLRAEVLEGRIVLSPTWTGRHALIYARLSRQIDRLLPADMDSVNNITLHMAATNERYVPDLVVMALDKLDSDDWLCHAEDARLVAEIVASSSARDDRVVKVRGYAASGVPIYLLVDPLDNTVTLFTSPAGESYRQAHRLSFGAMLSLPEPFAGEIDTSEFSPRR